MSGQKNIAHFDGALAGIISIVKQSQKNVFPEIMRKKVLTNFQKEKLN